MNTAYEQQEVDSAVQSLDPFYHHHEKRLLDTALNLLIDRFIDLFTDTVQLLDFGFFFFFQIAITLKRENKMLDSCPFLFHTAPANYTQRCNPKFLHLMLLDHPSPAFAF